MAEADRPALFPADAGNRRRFGAARRQPRALHRLVTAGIVAGLLISDRGAGFALIAFSLSCVIVAGVFAAFTVSWRTLFVQAAPGTVALAALVFLK